MTPFPQGVCPILPTPFSEDGEVDYDSLKTLSWGLVDMKVSAPTMFGIASEYYKLSDDERAEMTDNFLKHFRVLNSPRRSRALPRTPAPAPHLEIQMR